MRIRESIGYVGVKPERRQKDKGYQSFPVGWKACRTARLRPTPPAQQQAWEFHILPMRFEFDDMAREIR